jgi:hypothetical protein
MTFRSQASRIAGGLLFLGVSALSACDPSAAESEAGNIDPALSATFDSPEALARAVLQAFADEDVETLKALPLTKDEFRLYVWPRLPASRPERGVPLEYAWGDLSQKSRNAIATSFSRFKRHKLELLSLCFKGGATDYGDFVIHREPELRVTDLGSGTELSLALFGSVVEWRGKYQLLSYVTD